MVVRNSQDDPQDMLLTEDVSQSPLEGVSSSRGAPTETVGGGDTQGRLDWAHRYQVYLKRRVANNAYWADKAIRQGNALEATESTRWVRGSSLRRIRSLLRKGDCTLEVGCGNASSLLAPLSDCCQAFGLDLTWEMLLAAKREHRGIRGVIRSDACRLPFPDRKFDVVYTSRCLINVLESEMQSLAIREAFRVTKADGIVILIENFEEPVAAMNDTIAKWGVGSPIKDEHNLLLSLHRTLNLGRALGWRPIRIQGNTLASFVAHIVVRKIAWSRGATMLDKVLYPLYAVLTRIEDRLRVPLFGKDTMVVFKRE
jgi:SAM-dependent methyltransferase